jgi:hypothetical protein
MKTKIRIGNKEYESVASVSVKSLNEIPEDFIKDYYFNASEAYRLLYRNGAVYAIKGE